MSDLYEIVELDDGDIILRRAGDEGEALVSIQFSAEALKFLDTSKFLVAKTMIEAGLDAVSSEVESGWGDDLSDDQGQALILH
jgi:hypothetical protein